MGRHHLARVGSLGRVGRFTAVDQTDIPGTPANLRTARGLELGEVLASPGDEPDSASADGSILCGMTLEDELVEVRLEADRPGRFRRLYGPTERAAVARHADGRRKHLFDGQSLFFYFLGDTTPEVEILTAELAELYDAQVQFRKFTESGTMEGCGPGCGTENATCGGCTSCAVGCGGCRGLLHVQSMNRLTMSLH